MMSDFEVVLAREDDLSEFFVKFRGPPDSARLARFRERHAGADSPALPTTRSPAQHLTRAVSGSYM